MNDNVVPTASAMEKSKGTSMRIIRRLNYLVLGTSLLLVAAAGMHAPGSAHGAPAVAISTPTPAPVPAALAASASGTVHFNSCAADGSCTFTGPVSIQAPGYKRLTATVQVVAQFSVTSPCATNQVLVRVDGGMIIHAAGIQCWTSPTGTMLQGAYYTSTGGRGVYSGHTSAEGLHAARFSTIFAGPLSMSGLAG
jgi:hypothetical protein